jgi:hypothetical protein
VVVDTWDIVVEGTGIDMEAGNDIDVLVGALVALGVEQVME